MKSTFITGLLLASFMCVAGCEMGIWPESAQKALVAANEAYGRNDFKLTEQEASKAMSAGTASQKSYEAQYLRGMARLKLGEGKKAEDDLLKVSKRAKNLDLQIRATDSLAEVYFQQNRLDESDKLFKDVIANTLPEKQPSDHAHYRLACIAQKQGRWAEADVHYQKVIYLFPKSNYAALSRPRVGSTFWSIQVGNYEFKSKATTVAKKYAKSKLKPYIQNVMMDGKLRFVLLFGKWPTYAEAEKELHDRKAIFSGATLVPAK